jgi:hypothetical protein
MVKFAEQMITRLKTIYILVGIILCGLLVFGLSVVDDVDENPEPTPPFGADNKVEKNLERLIDQQKLDTLKAKGYKGDNSVEGMLEELTKIQGEGCYQIPGSEPTDCYPYWMYLKYLPENSGKQFKDIIYEDLDKNL